MSDTDNLVLPDDSYNGLQPSSHPDSLIDDVVFDEKKRKRKSEIKRPCSKWILYSTEMRAIVASEQPSIGFAEVGRVVAERYRNLSLDESNALEERVKKEKERYIIELEEAEDDPEPEMTSENLQGLSSTLAFPLVIFFLFSCCLHEFYLY
jgi:hypothetical protein